MIENLEDWLNGMVKAAQSESMFEDPKWDRVLAEIGRISVYFENLSFNLKLLLITLEKPRDLSANTNQYNHTFISEVIKKCRNAWNQDRTQQGTLWVAETYPNQGF